ncbi:hypothetical protein B7494_g3535 [Chlorociboria aeruginascens]|nr:hypothetical protein B7494_g3535 [Chlorociboria aeruginascens]
MCQQLFEEYYANEVSSCIEKKRSKSQKKKLRREANGGSKKKSAMAKPSKKSKAKKSKKAAGKPGWFEINPAQAITEKRRKLVHNKDKVEVEPREKWTRIAARPLRLIEGVAQTKTVHIYDFITKSTIDVDI